MTLRKIFALALIVLALGIFIFQVQMPKERAAEDAALLLGNIEQKDIQEIEIQRGDEKFVLQNGGKATGNEAKNSTGKSGISFNWSLKDIPYAPLDEGSVVGLAKTASGLQLGESLPPEDVEGDLGVYGLKEPAVSVRLKTKDLERTVDFGKRSDYLNERFIRVRETNKVYLIGDSFFYGVDKKRNEFRDKFPLRFDTEKAKSISISFKETKTELKNQNGSWELSAPVQVLADESQIAELERKLKALKVHQFRDGEEAKKDLAHLSTPDVTVSMTFDEDPVEIKMVVVDKEKPRTLAQISTVPQTIFEFEGSQVGDYLLSVEQLLDKSIFRHDDRDIASAEVQLNGEKTSFKVEKIEGGEKWVVNDKKAETQFVQSYFESIRDLQAVGLATDESKEFVPLLTLMISFQSGTPLKVEVSASEAGPGESFHRVRREGRKGIYLIDEQTYSKLIPKVEAMVSTESVPEAVTPLEKK